MCLTASSNSGANALPNIAIFMAAVKSQLSK
jgi:hypothetical protein